MNTRRFAKKGMAVLACVAAASIYVSGTVQTLTTPKVMTTQARRGKLREEIALPCALVFPEREKADVFLKRPVIVKSALVRRGSRVKTGDKLFSLLMEGEENIEEELTEALLEAEREKAGLLCEIEAERMKDRERAYMEAYLEFLKRTDEELKKKVQVGKKAPQGMSADESEPRGRDAIPAWREAKERLEESRVVIQKYAKDRGGEMARANAQRLFQADNRIEKAKLALDKFYKARQTLSGIYSKQSGCITEVAVREGETLAGYVKTHEISGAEPLLEAVTAGGKRGFSLGQKVKLETEKYGVFEGEIMKMGVDENGRPSIRMALPAKMAELLPVPVLDETEITAKITWTSPENHCLVPESAIQTIDGNNAVFLMEEKDLLLGGKETRVRQFNVTVLDRADGVAAIAENLHDARIAYMQDRDITNGDVVMRYGK